MFENWGWPQWVEFVLFFLNWAMYAALHGKPKTGNYDFMIYTVSAAVSIFILYAGGFWTPQP